MEPHRDSPELASTAETEADIFSPTNLKRGKPRKSTVTSSTSSLHNATSRDPVCLLCRQSTDDENIFGKFLINERSEKTLDNEANQVNDEIISESERKHQILEEADTASPRDDNAPHPPSPPPPPPPPLPTPSPSSSPLDIEQLLRAP